MRIGTWYKDDDLTFTQGISLDFYYLKRFSEFTVLYYEFNGFKSLEKTTAAERSDSLGEIVHLCCHLAHSDIVLKEVLLSSRTLLLSLPNSDPYTHI